MKTIKTFYASFAFLFLGLVPISAMGQSLPNTFTANTAAKASEVNANFTYLLNKFGTSKATVNCLSGVKADPDNLMYISIKEALKNHNYLVITGMCNEKVSLTSDLEGADLVKPTSSDDYKSTYDQSHHRLVILEGGSGGSISNGIQLIPDDDETNLIVARGSITLVVSKLKLLGGNHGIAVTDGARLRVGDSHISNNGRHGIGAWFNINLQAVDNVIENTTGTTSGFSCGIQLWGNSFGDIRRNTLIGHPHAGAVCLHQNSSAMIRSNMLSNSRDGLDVRIGSTVMVGISGSTENLNEISGNKVGIRVDESSAARIHKNKIYSNTEDGIRVSGSSHITFSGGTSIYNNSNDGIKLDGSSSLDMWCDKNEQDPTTFLNESGGQPNGDDAIDVGKGSTANLCHLSLKNHDRAINAGMGAVVNLNNSTLSENRGAGIWAYGARIDVSDSEISKNNQDDGDSAGIHLLETAQINLRRTQISENTGDGIHASKGAHISLDDNNTIRDNTDDGIHLYNGTTLMHGRGTVISGNTGDGILVLEGSSADLSELTIQNNGNHGMRISKVSSVNLSDTEISGNGEHGINITEASSLDAKDTIIKNNVKWGIWSGYGAQLELEKVSISGSRYGFHLVDKVSATVRGEVTVPDIFIALGSTIHFQGSASDLALVTCFISSDNVSGTNYQAPISYLFEHGNTGLATQSIRDDNNGNDKTNCPIFGW